MAVDRPRVSVVMPVYNGGDYLESAVDSVLAQSFRDFEIVLVNDGSKDDGRTHAICERYAGEQPGVVHYIQQENAGVGAALNAGIAAMRGDVFCWLSHDDQYEPQKLVRQTDFYDRLRKPGAILMSDYMIVDSVGMETARVVLDHATALRAPRFPLYRGWVNGCTIFVPKTVFPQEGPFDPRYRHVQDYRLWLQLLESHEIFHQPESLVRYRVHGGQDSGQPAAIVEADALWIDMLDGIKPAARAQISGSSRRFFEEERRHLEVSHYHGAADHAAAMSRATEHTPISVVVGVSEAGAPLLESLSSLAAHPDADLEIVLAPETPEIAAALSAMTFDIQVRKLPFDGRGAAATLNRALQLSSGDYVALLQSGDRFSPKKLALQSRAMQEAGALWSSTLVETDAEDTTPDASRISDAYDAILRGSLPHPSTVMLHRLLISEGQAFSRDDSPMRDPLFWLDIAARRSCLTIDAALTASDQPITPPQPDFDDLVLAALRDHPLHGLRVRALREKRARGEPAPIRPSETEDVAQRLEEFRNALDERIRFVSEPGYHQSLPLPLDLHGAGANYTHPAPDQPRPAARLTTGNLPWAYVAAIPFEKHDQAHLLSVEFVTESDEAYLRIVDSKYQPVIERRRLAPWIRGRIWFDIASLPHDLILIVQVGVEPTGQGVTIISSAQHIPDPNLNALQVATRSPPLGVAV